ncbi:MAG: alpha/beta fold hydrolase [Rhodospirillaceae bacterium]|jgi:pimeloyl-ACP methyl ester carboxylesterase|nr:alpha/beta fold hydrolase [Rhodospirillaceae bacterium]MBT6117086.1 alpha/beta fold hydrolase [Rhodospirillaceae bacterium]
MNDRRLLLIPGTLCDAELWRHQIDHLGDVAEVHVGRHSLDDHPDAIAQRLLDEMPPGPFAMAGLSMGGYLALAVMRIAPERVTRLCLLDTSARADTPEQAKRRADLVDLAQKGDFQGSTRRMLPVFIHPDRLEEEPLRSDVMAMNKRVGLEAYLRQQKANAARIDSRPHLGEIRCPTLAICGRQDILLPPEHSEELAAAIPGADLVYIEDCAHLPTMERPQATTALMHYWLVRD